MCYHFHSKSLSVCSLSSLTPILTHLSSSLSQTEGEDGSAIPLSDGDPGEAHDEVDLSCNALLWLGKDYSNFIKKDWTQLDQPFQGTRVQFRSLTTTTEESRTELILCGGSLISSGTTLVDTLQSSQCTLCIHARGHCAVASLVIVQ